MKSCIVITSFLLMLVPAYSADTSQQSEHDYLSTVVDDGIWVNDTLVINGSTTLNPQSANWVLYDVTDPYTSSWPIIGNGGYFSEVLPVSEGLWSWTLTIDVSGVNCTCWLEISLSKDGQGKEILNRIVFVGEGPHNPVISNLDGNSILIDGPKQVSFKAILADSLPIESSLILTGCLAPTGACVGESFTTPVEIEWVSSIATFTINASSLGLTDGIWKFNYVLQDTYLRISPPVEITVYVDQSDPLSSLICPDNTSEGSDLLIDGSGSTDDPWIDNTQFIWYITGPDNSVYSPTSVTTEELLNITLEKSGEYTIRLDVIDWVGRMSTSQCAVNVSNVAPVIDLIIEGSEVSNPKTWNYFENEDIQLVSLISETGDDLSTIQYSWYIDDKLVSNSANYSPEGLEVGDYQLRLVVVDDDGAEETYNLELSVKPTPKSDSSDFNIAATIVIFGIIGFSVFMFMRMNSSENSNVNLPKWNDSANKESQQNKEDSNDENRLWE